MADPNEQAPQQQPQQAPQQQPQWGPGPMPWSPGPPSRPWHATVPHWIVGLAILAGGGGLGTTLTTRSASEEIRDVQSELHETKAEIIGEVRRFSDRTDANNAAIQKTNEDLDRLEQRVLSIEQNKKANK